MSAGNVLAMFIGCSALALLLMPRKSTANVLPNDAPNLPPPSTFSVIKGLGYQYTGELSPRVTDAEVSSIAALVKNTFHASSVLLSPISGANRTTVTILGTAPASVKVPLGEGRWTIGGHRLVLTRIAPRNQ